MASYYILCLPLLKNCTQIFLYKCALYLIDELLTFRFGVGLIKIIQLAKNNKGFWMKREEFIIIQTKWKRIHEDQNFRTSGILGLNMNIQLVFLIWRTCKVDKGK